jgi:hypothetical protein
MITLQAARRKDAGQHAMLRHAVQRPRQKLGPNRKADKLAVLGATLRRKDVGFKFCVHGVICSNLRLHCVERERMTIQHDLHEPEILAGRHRCPFRTAGFFDKLAQNIGV